MKTKPSLYPLLFVPILKEKIWGGNKLEKLFNKKGKGSIGESWELSGVAENVSIVKNGILKGTSIVQLIETYKEDLVGVQVFKKYKTTFPLLFKFIDAQQDLSVQLHPDDTLAQERHQSYGKTEMWYILHAEKEARLIIGFNTAMNEKKYLKNLSEGKITEILQSQKVSTGDTFFIAPGTVHAIGAGVVLAEIQQTSDITYRIYDWDRPDTNGRLRELHTEQALAAINYQSADAKIDYTDLPDTPVVLKKTSYFVTQRLKLTQPMERDLSLLDSFVVYMCVEGSVKITTSTFKVNLQMGETLLIPAVIPAIDLQTTNATLLEVYMPYYR